MSRYLLDTHLLLWAGIGSERLSATTIARLEDPETDVRFSAVSLWEIVIKSQLERADFRVDPEALRAYARLAGMPEVNILAEHVLGVLRLPHLHRDPFDRLLVAQARHENLILLTADENVLAYGHGVERA